MNERLARELEREITREELPNRQALDEPTGVSTFRAVESLGLKLERRRAPIDVVASTGSSAPPPRTDPRALTRQARGRPASAPAPD